MPGMSGIEVARKVKKYKQAGKLNTSVILVLVTGDDVPVGSETYNLFDKVLSKPISPNELKNFVTKILNQRK